MKGEIYALLAALTWGCAVVLFKRGGEYVGPVALNLFKNLLALVLLFFTLFVDGDPSAPFALLSGRELWLLCLSGVLGIAVADSLLFASLNRVGVTRVAIIDCLYTPSIIFFSWFFLGEVIGVSHYVGGALIILGIFISGQRRRVPLLEQDRLGRELWFGMFLGAAAIMTMTFSIVMVKPILQRVPLVWATTLRLLVGSGLLVLWLLITRRDELVRLMRPHPSWRFNIPAAILGTYLSMLFWVGGFKYARASIAGLLNQSSIVFAIVLSAIFLKEPLTRPKLIAIGLATTGVLTVTLRLF